MENSAVYRQNDGFEGADAPVENHKSGGLPGTESPSKAPVESRAESPVDASEELQNGFVAPEGDLFHETRIRDVFQNERGIVVRMDRSRDAKLTAFGKATLTDRYLMPGESYQDLFARVSAHFADDSAHAQRVYDYMSNLWFMPATPVLSNGGTNRGLPISCFLNEANDSLEGIVGLWNENVWLAARGGGIGSYWGNLRSIGEKVGRNGKTSGVIPFIRVMDSLTLAISQGSLRRGSAACYIPISHPEIEEFIEMRRPTGGDPNRKALNLHHGIVISDAFMRAVENDEEWALTSPADNHVVRKVKARALWVRLLTARIETGEPYILYGDHVNRAIPEHQKLAGLSVKMSNLCSEITLPTGLDHRGEQRTAVCCLSSLNLETYDEWENEEGLIEDVMRFLDNVLSDFIARAPESMARARYSAMRERSVGLGVMGFHSFLQARRIPLEGVMAKVWNKKVFEKVRKEADAASIKLADERGACPDAAEFGIKERFSNKMAIAPTASISIICGGASPGIEPFAANAFTHKTLSGSFAVRNKHLEELLEEKGHNDDQTWSSITINEGSVQHLDFLTQDEKDCFKTAFELDQRWLIELAADRAPFVCQAQSLNVFLPADVHKRDLHQIHFQAWKKGVKSLYYCRSKSLQRAESSMGDKAGDKTALPFLGKVNSADRPVVETVAASTDYEECLSCQ
ncbi:ribonucleoside-diphosphate reductase alpha chain [Limibacillus halophilus]|uniref:Ribonucleoside-diphosphate reductase n=2 Tax=Limibacillus halophilus TaxID=1579333 RepID=A0A839SR10_9PROT|nr:ribonucleoside-diphosphate reductase subunit alpha [Limibacillus halophilus]MBB3064718.1 ribonucleoside-diphosphate reductase alpha chain [Limibacillus halophilus]